MMRRFDVFLLLSILLFSSHGVYALNQKALETKIQSLKEKLQQKRASYLKIRARYYELSRSMLKVEKSIRALKLRMANSQKELDKLSSKIKQLRQEIGGVSGDLLKQKEQLYRELNEYYKYQCVSKYYARGIWYSKMNGYIAAYMQEKIKRYLKHKEYLKRRMDRLKNYMERKKKILEKIKKQKSDLNRQMEELAKLKEDAKRQKEAYLRQIDMLSKEQKRLQSILANIIAQQKKRMEQERKKRLALKRRKAKHSAVYKNRPGAFVKGMLIAPVKGKVIDTFGKKYDNLFKVYTRNDGIDIKAKAGSCVRAVYSGKVDYVGRLLGYGGVIIINHLNGYYTVYGGVKARVRLGQRVKGGECIGRMETDKLHFEIRWHAKAINPLKLLSRRYLR